ncbi:MAG TPA: acyltransferase [Xanthobacteraceae bacterium]|nr:acyltransferase [Xanthobacteraceae bacterium]
MASHSSSKAKHEHVPVLDLLRLFAALGVVLFHYAFRGAAAENFTVVSLPSVEFLAKYGWFGVQLFFIISGFVIARSAVGRGPVQFGIARFARLWPAFVVCTTLTALITWLWGAPRFETSVPQWLANLTMVAPALRQPFMDGAYWSIVIEITFYAWFALFIALGQFPKRTDDIVLGWLSIALVNEALIHSSIMRHLFMTEYAGFFCAGILIAEIANGRRGWQAPFLIVVSTVIASSEALVGARETAVHYSVPFSTTMMITLTVLSVALVWLASRIRSLPLPKGILLATGGLTYPLYLLHQHIGYIAFNRLHEYAPAWLLVLGMTLAMIALSYVIWRYIEPAGRRLVTTVLNAVAEVALPPLTQFASWYARKASSWISGVPIRIK